MSTPEPEQAEWLASHNGCACSGGFLLLDSAGIVFACDGKFAELFSVPSSLPVPDQTIERIFPSGLTPRDLILAAANGTCREGAVVPGAAPGAAPCVVRLLAADNRTVAASLHLSRLGEWWLLGIQLTDNRQQGRQAGFLRDLFASRKNIAGYLHNTLSQHLVAMSLLLARLRRDPVTGSAPDFIRTASLCDTCSRDLRVLGDALTPVLPATGECKAEEVISDLQWYLERLRDDAGLHVRFEVNDSSGSSVSVRPEVRMLLGAALQRWAEVAINHVHSGETNILFTHTTHGFTLQFLSSQPHDPGIEAILCSHGLRESVRAAGGVLGPVTSHKGESACLTLPGCAVTEFLPETILNE